MTTALMVTVGADDRSPGGSLAATLLTTAVLTVTTGGFIGEALIYKALCEFSGIEPYY